VIRNPPFKWRYGVVLGLNEGRNSQTLLLLQTPAGPPYRDIPWELMLLLPPSREHSLTSEGWNYRFPLIFRPQPFRYKPPL